MKVKKRAVFFLILFSLFLAMPSIITIAGTATDTSYIFSITEEETERSCNEIKNDTPVDNTLIFRLCIVFPSEIIHNITCTETFYSPFYNDTLNPPPEQQL